MYLGVVYVKIYKKGNVTHKQKMPEFWLTIHKAHKAPKYLYLF